VPTGIDVITPETLSALVAISLFRSGWDTSAARHAKSVLVTTPRHEWVNVVASLLWREDFERRRQVDLAYSQVDAVLKLARSSGHSVLTCLDDSYPELLKAIPDPPVVLWTQGDPSLLLEPAVAVVGSRNALPVSITIARMLARDLADAGLVVVSGMARGVDSAAHAGALDAGGKTIAVVGCGLTRVYPSRNEKLAGAIRESGAIISELPPEAMPLPPHFPLRNRIISGLSLAAVIIEAGQKSGSLITAGQALEQGRSVLAVPGNPISGRHRGSHDLIKDGAALVDTVEDVLFEIGWTRRPSVESTGRNHLQLSDLESNMAKGESYSVDNLARKTRRSTPDLLADLSVLELSGRVMRTATGDYIRLRGPEGEENE
jgi:DNA processing protein